MKRKAVFTDRDGTINRDVHYLSDPNGLELYPTVAEGIRLLNDAGFLVVVVTNQSGITRGLFTLETLDAIHCRLLEKLAEAGARVDAFYYCPHHPDDGCNCRKPRTGLLQRAVADHGIDPSVSFFMGDRMMDVEAGQGIGCRTVLVPERLDLVKKEKERSRVRPHFECRTFLEGVHWILAHEREEP